MEYIQEIENGTLPQQSQCYSGDALYPIAVVVLSFCYIDSESGKTFAILSAWGVISVPPYYRGSGHKFSCFYISSHPSQILLINTNC